MKLPCIVNLSDKRKNPFSSLVRMFPEDFALKMRRHYFYFVVVAVYYEDHISSVSEL